MEIKKELIEIIRANSDKKIIFEINLNSSICKALILFLNENNIIDNYHAWEGSVKSNDLKHYFLYINKNEKFLFKPYSAESPRNTQEGYGKYLKQLGVEFLVVNMYEYYQKGKKKKLKI